MTLKTIVEFDRHAIFDISAAGVIDLVQGAVRSPRQPESDTFCGNTACSANVSCPHTNAACFINSNCGHDRWCF
ncbi:MAG: hypothetical protein HYV18_06740 [Gammaproteobacteria bacterium]|nr:hypothetical protein [Gammaproteobacteria bacterium]